eukprot:scaffold25623_cov101-Isochrysis_galbana.AAC.4
MHLRPPSSGCMLPAGQGPVLAGSKPASHVQLLVAGSSMRPFGHLTSTSKAPSSGVATSPLAWAPS